MMPAPTPVFRKRIINLSPLTSWIPKGERGKVRIIKERAKMAGASQKADAKNAFIAISSAATDTGELSSVICGGRS